jgi:hypothetical protein
MKRIALLCACLGLAPEAFAGCAQNVGRAAVTLSMQGSPQTPYDAMVIIDEEYIGPLAYVAARGVRLPVGEHRITVQKDGFFPWDELVVADRQPIKLRVELVPIPD